MSIDVQNITSVESAKKKLQELSEDYKELTDDLLKKSYEVAICREQINNCLELIAAFNSQKETVADGE